MTRAIPITARGAEKLRAELQRLRGVDRPAVIQAIRDAREKGDLSENAEYDAARERQGFIEGRIKELEGKLASLQIIDPTTIDAAGRVVFGATVELEDDTTGEAVKYQIVGDDEGDVPGPVPQAAVLEEGGDERIEVERHRLQVERAAGRRLEAGVLLADGGLERAELPHGNPQVRHASSPPPPTA